MSDFEDGSEETRSDLADLESRGESLNEDTEDASETGSISIKIEDDDSDAASGPAPHDSRNYGHTQEHEVSQMRDQAYQEKKQEYIDEYVMLDDRTHPAFKKKFAQLKREYEWEQFKLKCSIEAKKAHILKEHEEAIARINGDFEERKVELKESLLQDREEKRRAIELETIDLSSDFADMKTMPTRKLRRRPNDPLPIPDRRRRPSPVQTSYLLPEEDIESDLKKLAKSMARKAKSGGATANQGESSSSLDQNCSSSLENEETDQTDARIEDNKLYYEKKWYLRGQHVILESSNGHKMNTSISHVSSNEILFKKSNESGKIKVLLSDLVNRKFTIRKG